MRIVLDTNVVVSALIWGGTPGKLVQMAIDDEVELFTSPNLLDELHEVLTREHLASRLGPRYASVEEAVVLYGDRAVSVTPKVAQRVVPGDADDDQVIAATIAGRVDLIVSGDRHLLVLGGHLNIRIVTPAMAVRLIGDA